MKLEEQVCSLELAKKLKELGAKQESAFYFETIVNEEGDRSVTNLRFGKFFDDAANNRHVSYIAAFTVAELGEMLPKDSVFLHAKPVHDIYLWESRQVMFPDGTIIMPQCGETLSRTEADSRAKMLIYLIEQGIVKP